MNRQSYPEREFNRRILVIDDNLDIHDDYRKILSGESSARSKLREASSKLFGGAAVSPMVQGFDVHFASQGQEGLETVRKAHEQRMPYALAFVDMVMPPGWDGVTTIEQLWQVDSDLQVVLCTAYSDIAWETIIDRLAKNDRLLILRKPFDSIEVWQIANALTSKWQLQREARDHQDRLEARVRERTQELQHAKEAAERAGKEAETANFELRVALKQMEHLAEIATAANQAKDQFLANMSHELRTPMNGIIGYANFLAETSLDEEQREFVNTLQGCSEALLGIINEVLDFSRMEAGSLSVEKGSFNLRKLVEQVADLLCSKAEQQGLELVLDFAEGTGVEVLGDLDRTRQVLMNLIGNALKFTEQGHVLVVLDYTPDSPATLRCSVLDTGIGIPPEKEAVIFDGFSQVDNSNTRKFGGTGLGLATAKRLMELMGGNLGFTSLMGHGSTFWFTLPLSRVSPTDEDTAISLALEDVRILVISELEILRQALGQQLDRWKISHSVAASDEEALRLLSEACHQGRAFHIAIVDSSLSGIDGSELVRRIRAVAEFRTTSFVLLTRGTRKADLLSSLALEGVAYLIKPVVQPAKLAAVLRTLWKEYLETNPRLSPASPLQSASTTSQKLHPRVLLAEDNPVNLSLAKRMLERLGCRVDVAVNGNEAVERTQLKNYDLIFMDCQMPELNGYEAAAAIRQREGGRCHTPIIAVTANALRGDREKCLHAGMDDYISKPISLSELRRVCQQWGRPSDRETGQAQKPQADTERCP